jgi:inosine-uridine nucleoside N-ribohydrolase
MTTKLIIDTDPGVDDAMAIHYAFAHPDLDVLALTSIFGNVWVEQATRNALILAEQAAYPCLVAEGEAQPLVMPPNAPSHYVHGDEGFGDLPAMTPKGKPDPRPAYQVIVDYCRQYPGEVVLAPVGPLTNIAKLLEYDPEITGYVKKVVIMGGAVRCPGNVSDYAEANIWNDPHAADRVFAADWPVELIGLDITQKIKCHPEHFDQIAQSSPEIGGFLREISAFYIKFYQTVIGEYVCLMHDPTAIIAITNPDLITFEELPLEVVLEGEAIGQTRPSRDASRRPVRVAMAADGEKIRKTFLDICGETDKIAALRK